MKIKNILSATAMAILMGTAMVSCGDKSGNKATSPLGLVACDESFERILQQEVEVFEYCYPQYSIMPYYVNEKAAVDSLLDLGNVRTAILARELTEKEKAFFKSHDKNVRQQQIAVDAIALIVNTQNPIEQLSVQELRDILAGKLKTWGEIEPNKTGAIDIVFDHQGSSTVQYMRDSLMNGKNFGGNVFAQKSNDDVFKAVEANPRAIGIIGVSWISSDLKHKEPTTEELAKIAQSSDTTELSFDTRVKVLKVAGDGEVVAYKPYQTYIFEGKYPLFRPIYMTTVATGGTTSSKFYDFVTGPMGQKLIVMTGVLPARLFKRQVQVTTH